ncbi:hypothetical protein SAMN05421770_11521 [Granulicella rosea]|uniref:Uncharacterized protein n=1 Tax=Granulicella rosea TaxID=474952 RepID=A0A239MLS7_9BACT|nr:hypothetical protein [Granulicella rosea]SNT43213.1 hypothetical protein SAMN05421770_11521 [Granulicella rosea]
MEQHKAGRDLWRDVRCPFWNLQTELDGRGVEDAIAAAMLPEKQFENGFFTDAPRRVLANLLRKGGSVATLLEWMAEPRPLPPPTAVPEPASIPDPPPPENRGRGAGARKSAFKKKHSAGREWSLNLNVPISRAGLNRNNLLSLQS